jgi:hypothetical protein
MFADKGVVTTAGIAASMLERCHGEDAKSALRPHQEQPRCDGIKSNRRVAAASRTGVDRILI